MKKLLAVFGVFVLLAGTSQAAFAKGKDCNRDWRWDNNRRVERGYYNDNNNRLSWGERNRWNNQQRRIDRMADRFRADGYLSPAERQRLRLAVARENARYQRDWWD